MYLQLYSYEVFSFLHSHKSRVKGHLRLKMTYLPENPGSEEDTTDHSEEVSQ